MADVTFDALGRWPGVLGRLMTGESLSEDEAASVMDEVLDGSAKPAQIAAALVALRIKGETVAEISGFVRAMLAHAEPLSIPGEPIDVVGTGGDRLASINVSTLAALIAAGAGARVCKHGNRAASSSVGTADVLEALGVVVDLGPEGVARCVIEAGMGFCFAPRFHPAMRHAGPVRRELGVPTVFNVLGPLANPARVRRQLVGVSEPRMAPMMAEVLARSGSVRAMVMYADDGLDELSITAPSTVLEVRAGGGPAGDAGDAGRAAGDARGDQPEVRTWRLDAADFGFGRAPMSALRGGDAAFNASVIRRVLDGEPGAPRDIGVLNAAAALVVSGHADDLGSAVALASASVDDGCARDVLSALVRVSNEAAASPQTLA